MPYSILLIDDHAAFRNGLKYYLNQHELLQVEYEAVNGEEGLKLAQLHDFDAIVLDVNMPVMNGYEVIKNLQSHHKPYNVAVLTSLFSTNAIQKMLALGVNAYLTKEDDLDELTENIALVAQGQCGIMSPYAEKTLKGISPLKKTYPNLEESDEALLQALGTGQPNWQIAQQQQNFELVGGQLLSETTHAYTLQPHMSRIELQTRIESLMEKIQCRDRTALLDWAWANGELKQI